MKAPTLDRAAVLRLAELAQLISDSGIDHARVDGLVRDLERIVAYAAELSEVDVDGVAPMERPAHATGGGNEARGRADDPHAELNRDVLLGEAPRVESSGFSVPPFMDEG